MKRNPKTATVLAAMTILITAVMSWLVFAFLPVSPERVKLSAGCLVGGIVSSLVLYAVVTRLPDKRRFRIVAVSLFVVLVSMPLTSALMPRITFARFGFTVYGATPIPVLDITVNRHGVLWFRPKTHRITRAELESLVTPEVDVIVVGIGWDSVAQLTDNAARLVDTIDLRVLPTPEAFAVYNALKAEGRTVVLLAHSTC